MKVLIYCPRIKTWNAISFSNWCFSINLSYMVNAIIITCVLSIKGWSFIFRSNRLVYNHFSYIKILWFIRHNTTHVITVLCYSCSVNSYIGVYCFGIYQLMYIERLNRIQEIFLKMFTFHNGIGTYIEPLSNLPDKL